MTRLQKELFRQKEQQGKDQDVGKHKPTKKEGHAEGAGGAQEDQSLEDFILHVQERHCRVLCMGVIVWLFFMENKLVWTMGTEVAI